ncbi:MAG TPA: glycosyltransferase family 9 protein, partial [Saprospiraceae bacterium]|nr:glycosyltransferase family 9 protein [Saprospiraceae bacterium]
MKFLLIQTAFIGDVVLATPLIEKLRHFYPDADIDFMVRKGNESLLTGHPLLRKVWVFNKQDNKIKNLFRLVKLIRKEKYDYVINAQRFFSSGLITVLSGAKTTIGFDKNPLSFLFSRKLPHIISKTSKNIHEVDRNLSLIESLTDASFYNPKLYPSKDDFEKVKTKEPYICIAPASVWFTKQYPKERWIEFINAVPDQFTIYLIGAKSDSELCQEIISKVTGDGSYFDSAQHKRITNLAGQLSFLESAALMQGAVMNYVNDSAPLHFASS